MDQLKSFKFLLFLLILSFPATHAIDYFEARNSKSKHLDFIVLNDNFLKLPNEYSLNKTSLKLSLAGVRVKNVTQLEPEK